MPGVLVDTNVILDLLTDNSQWSAWSAEALLEAGNKSRLLINLVIFAEISVGFDSIERATAAIPPSIERDPIPYEAAFLAGKVFLRYRKAGGARLSTLPDFFIGAHAAISGYELLTRDPARYRTYFPKLKLIAPD